MLSRITSNAVFVLFVSLLLGGAAVVAIKSPMGRKLLTKGLKRLSSSENDAKVEVEWE